MIKRKTKFSSKKKFSGKNKKAGSKRVKGEKESYEYDKPHTSMDTGSVLQGTSVEITNSPGKRGRKKGTPNEITLRLMEVIEEKYPNYHPVVAMAHMANNRTLDPELRFRCHKEVAPYLAPRRKSVEITDPGEGGGVTIPVTQYDEKQIAQFKKIFNEDF
jgi:hypothetical protein